MPTRSPESQPLLTLPNSRANQDNNTVSRSCPSTNNICFDVFWKAAWRGRFFTIHFGKIPNFLDTKGEHNNTTCAYTKNRESVRVQLSLRDATTGCRGSGGHVPDRPLQGPYRWVARWPDRDDGVLVPHQGCIVASWVVDVCALLFRQPGICMPQAVQPLGGVAMRLRIYFCPTKLPLVLTASPLVSPLASCHPSQSLSPTHHLTITSAPKPHNYTTGHPKARTGQHNPPLSSLHTPMRGKGGGPSNITDTDGAIPSAKTTRGPAGLLPKAIPSAACCCHFPPSGPMGGRADLRDGVTSGRR